MAKNIKTSDFKIDDDICLKSQKIHINGKKLITPIKSVNMAKIRRDTPINNKVKGINEIFKTLNNEKINDYITGTNDESNITKNILSNLRKTDSKDVNLCFIQHEDNKLPEEEKAINFIMNIAYEYSDATPLPILPKYFSDETSDFLKIYENYLNFMKSCIESINRLNNKPIIGIIPIDIPSAIIGDLVNFYHNNDITSFAYDFNGKVYAGSELKVRELMTTLIDLDLLDNSFIYCCNITPGKMMKGAPIVRATDVMTYNFGFDAIGDNHIRKRLPRSLIESFKKRKGKSAIRLFNSEDYGYYKTTELSLLKQIYPTKETNIPFDTFRVDNAKSKQCQTLFNTERIGLESLKYQTILNDSSEAVDYLKTKEFIRDKDIRKFMEFRNKINI